MVIIKILFFLSVTNAILANETDETGVQPKLGCHLVGYTRKVNIPGCIEFSVTTNACRGFCESFAVSSKFAVGPHRPEQPIISVGQCCNIMENEELKVKVRCLEGIREVTFGSATSCSCFHCKKS
ncbi:hypothetical protein PVAND_017528 [Polypedilum vanderplanki]|uniref:Glycoprotein hormone subunit beta domain-containing protein n=1 Tax=Polypedilum vanderplanki TaxID=319348 RepID=A0A9J6BIK0_POLVA|nr:hypothetical protein PVAND_017528 [Polypedilum vanderplanki]